MVRPISLCWLALLTVAAIPVTAAAEPRVVTAPDLLAFDRISGITPSPNGAWLAFSRGTTDVENFSRRGSIWLQSTTAGTVRQFTTDPSGGDSPHWEADSNSILFVSSRSGSSQVWRRALDGSAAEQVTALPLDLYNLVVSPDGSQLAFTIDVFADCDSLDCTVKRMAAEETRTGSGQLYDSLFIRHWRGYEDGLRSHLFVMPTAGGDPIDVTAGMDADVPSQPFGGSEEFTFTPDGRELVFTMKDAGKADAWSVDFNLYVVPVDGSSPPRILTADNKAWDTYPVFSPDGSQLAYLAMTQPGYESDRFRIVIRDWPKGTTRILTEQWDHSPGEITWSPKGDELLVTAANVGQTSLFAIDATSGKARTIVATGSAGSIAPVDDTIYFMWDDLVTPAEIHSVPIAGGDHESNSSFHQAQLEQLKLGDFEAFTFPGWNDEAVSAYIVKPVDLDESKHASYPVVLLIHGGPQSSSGNHFQGFTSPHIWAGAGYATIMIDFHGSVGYGQAFSDSIRGDYGGKPYIDLMKGLDYALERYPWLDGDRMAAVGRSFAGFMVNWIAGQAPDRFSCLVSHAGRVDERSAYLSTDELWFPEWDHEGTIWDNPDGYERHNPINSIDQWKTPMLVVHGGRDYRVAMAQSVATFTALQRRGIKSQFLYFPNEGHSVSRPQNRVQWHTVVLDWFAGCL